MAPLHETMKLLVYRHTLFPEKQEEQERECRKEKKSYPHNHPLTNKDQDLKTHSSKLNAHS